VENLKRNEVQRLYTAELGIKEKTGHNDGPRVEEYLRQVGLKKGDPWCAAFVCWVFDRACVANPHTGWSPRLFPKEKVIWQRKAVVQTGGKLRNLHPPPLPPRRRLRDLVSGKRANRPCGFRGPLGGELGDYC
jgi:hypothetical protein